MTGPHRDPRVDEYIAALPHGQQAICHHIRELVHAVDPDARGPSKRRG